MSIRKSKARKLAEFLRNITAEAKLTTEAVQDDKVVTTGSDLDSKSTDTTALVSAASVTSYVGDKLDDYVHNTHDINLTFTGDVTGHGTITDMGHTSFNLTLDAETLPVQTGYAGKFLTTDGTTASWATVDTSKGDTAYSWGDHSTVGYLTSFTETDPTVPSHVKSITTTDVSQWDAAYSWGDHSQEGYLTSETNDYVDSVSFSTSSGVLSLGRTGSLPNLTVDLDGRYLQSYVDTTYNVSAVDVSGGKAVRLTGSDGSTDDVKFAAGSNVSLARSGDTITISSTDTNTDTNTTDWYVANSSGGNQFKVDKNENVRFEGTGATSVSFNASNNKITISSTDTNTETTTNLVDNGDNTITYTNEEGTAQTIDLSLYLDDTNLARILSGTMNSSGVATFTRDDSTTFTVDMSVLLDDTNLSRITSASWNTSNGVLTLTRNDNTTVAVDLDNRYLTGYTETDTLDSVVGRGNTTSRKIVLSNTQTIGSSVSTMSNASILIGSTSNGIGIDNNEIMSSGEHFYIGTASGNNSEVRFRQGGADRFALTTSGATLTGNLSVSGTITGSINYNQITNPPTIDNSVDYINAASFNTSTGVLTLSGVGRAGATIDLDGRYLRSETDNQTLSWNGSNGQLSISNGNTVDLDNRYLTSYSETDTLQSVTNRGNTTTQVITANDYRFGNGDYVKRSVNKWVAGYADNFSNGSTGWKTIAKIRLTSGCSGDTLYGTLYENAYHDARVYQIAVVARAECDFTTNNESHVVEVGCTTIAAAGDSDYRNKIRVSLVESSTNSRTYELQVYETPWNSDKWELCSRENSTGNNIWTKYTSGQTIGTATGTPRVTYHSKVQADYVRARTEMRAPVFYDSDSPSHYADFANSDKSVVIAGKYHTNKSSGTIASIGTISDAVGHNPSYGTYIGGTSGSYLYHGTGDYPIYRTGSTNYQVWTSKNFNPSSYSTTSVSDGRYVRKSGDTMTGALIGTDAHFNHIGIRNTSSTTGDGIALYGGATGGQPTYGLMFAGTPTYGTHGGVTSDWATYFTMNDSTNRGWIFKRGTTNVASIDGGGDANFNDITGRGKLYFNKNGQTGYHSVIDIDHVENNLWPFVFQSSTVGNDNESGFWVGNNGYPDMRLRRENGTVRALISSWEESYVSNGFRVEGTTELNGALFVGTGTSSNIYMRDSDHGQRRIHCNSNRIGFLNEANGWGSYCGDGGDWYSDQSIRTPTFYDSNDTGRYLNPASDSRLNKVRLYNRLSIGSNSLPYEDSGTGEAGVWLSGSATNATWFLGLQTASSSAPLRFYAGADRFTFTRDGHGTASGSYRAPIFYDSDNTGYFLNPASGSNLNQIRTAGHISVGNHGDSSASTVSTSAVITFGSLSTDAINNYSIQTRKENYGGNYNKLDLSFHTGIRLGAHPNYGGVRFFSDQTMGTEIASIGKSGNFIVGNNSVRSPIFYDSNDTTYYYNPNDNSVQYGRIKTRTNRDFSGYEATSSSGGRAQSVLTSYYSDVIIASQQTNTNHGSTLSFTAVNPSNTGDYRKFVVNQGNWGGSHLLRFGWRDGVHTNPHSYVEGSFGGTYDVLGLDGSSKIVYAFGQLRTPIMYDNNDTGYYLNPASTSRVNRLDVDIMYDKDNTAYYVRPASTSILNDARANIFYDRNNTGYYLHADSTSNLKGLTVANTISGNISGNAGTATHLPTRYIGGQKTNPQTYFGQSVGLKVAMTGAPSVWSDTLWINGYSGSDVKQMCALHTLRNGQPRMYISAQACDGTSYGSYKEFVTYGTNYNSGAIYAGLYYDHNDTGYFCDPNSTTRLNNLNVLGGVASTTVSATYGNAAIEVREYNFGGAQTDSYSYAPRIGFHWSGRVASQIALASNGEIRILDNPGSGYEDLRANKIFAQSEMQAPIYYDKNNTAFYVHADSTSVLSKIWCKGASANTAPRWDTSFHVAQSQHFYGHNGSQEMYIGESNNVNIRSNGIASSSFRAPIFYDSNNTGYYVHADSNSNLNTLSMNGSLTFNNYGVGVTGRYSSTRFQQVFGMDNQYSLASDGVSPSNMYGIAWTHSNNTNTNGRKISGHHACFMSAGTTRAAIGDHIWTSGNITAYSDRRVKTNIEHIPDALDKVCKLNGYTFDRTDFDLDIATGEMPNTRQTGVIAQEVLEVLPEAVTGSEEEHYSVAYGNMVGLLIEAIKEQQTQIEELSSQLNSLKEK